MARPLGHKDGTLLLYTQDAIAAQQLTYYVPELLERINSFFGEEVFDKVRFELLNGRVPLGQQNTAEISPPVQPQTKPNNLGGLVDKFDPDSAVGRCYLAYVRHFSEQPAENATNDANTRPYRASRRRT